MSKPMTLRQIMISQEHKEAAGEIMASMIDECTDEYKVGEDGRLWLRMPSNRGYVQVYSKDYGWEEPDLADEAANSPFLDKDEPDEEEE